MFNNISIITFITLTVAQVIGFLLLIKLKLTDKKLTGEKGAYGPDGPRGNKGNIGIQPNPLPCPTSSPGSVDGDCHILDWQFPELKGKQGLHGKRGIIGISNWDSENANFHNLTCPNDGTICVSDELISSEVRRMEQVRARNFWNVYIPPPTVASTPTLPPVATAPPPPVATTPPPTVSSCPGWKCPGLADGTYCPPNAPGSGPGGYTCCRGKWVAHNGCPSSTRTVASCPGSSCVHANSTYCYAGSPGAKSGEWAKQGATCCGGKWKVGRKLC
jgi:hypothetical protein